MAIRPIESNVTSALRFGELAGDQMKKPEVKGADTPYARTMSVMTAKNAIGFGQSVDLFNGRPARGHFEPSDATGSRLTQTTWLA